LWAPAMTSSLTQPLQACWYTSCRREHPCTLHCHAGTAAAGSLIFGINTVTIEQLGSNTEGRNARFPAQHDCAHCALSQ
jgi:hypothetical protein